jgi:hypothetical protein
MEDATRARSERSGRAPRVFLLSPARLGGKRAAMLLRPGARFDLARRVQGGGAPLGEVMTFVSGLYFRGKLAYARAFAAPPPEVPGVPVAFVILPQGGLAPVDSPVTREQIDRQGERDVDDADPRYRRGLLAATRALARELDPATPIILLGSIASDRYCGPLLEAIGPRPPRLPSRWPRDR